MLFSLQQFFENSYDTNLMNVVFGFNDTILNGQNGLSSTNGTASPASLCPPLPGNSERTTPTAQSSSSPSPRTSPIQGQNGTPSSQSTSVSSVPVTVTATNGSVCGSSAVATTSSASSVTQPVAAAVSTGDGGH